jgi:uncharacterized RDD family membrane protein YckC
MRLAVQRDPNVASLPRRTAAGTIDSVIWLLGWGAAIFVASKARMPWARARGHDAQGWSARARMMGSLTSSTEGASRALTLATPNQRSPGMLMLGLRRVDARTGGPIATRQAIVRSLADNLERKFWHELIRPASERADLRRQAAQDEVARIREARPDADRDELMRDEMEIQRRHNASCAPTPRTLAPFALASLSVLRSRRRQLPGERLAGTVVIHER